jgi:hypothetical protein
VAELALSGVVCVISELAVAESVGEVSERFARSALVGTWSRAGQAVGTAQLADTILIHVVSV